MNVKRTLAAVALTGALVATTAACSTDDDCGSTGYIYVVGGVYHYGSPTGPTVPKRYTDPKTGKLKPGVSIDKGGKVKAPSTGTGSKPGFSKPNTGGSKSGGFSSGRTGRR